MINTPGPFAAIAVVKEPHSKDTSLNTRIAVESAYIYEREKNYMSVF